MGFRKKLGPWRKLRPGIDVKNINDASIVGEGNLVVKTNTVKLEFTDEEVKTLFTIGYKKVVIK